MSQNIPEPGLESWRWIRFCHSGAGQPEAMPADHLSITRVLHGDHMKDHAGLFSEFASALDFPAYFGRNWPALSDCLDDLEWLGEFSEMNLVIETWSSVLHDSPPDLAVLCRILEQTGENWFRLGRDGSGKTPVSFRTTALI